jgi:hypothetical protein
VVRRWPGGGKEVEKWRSGEMERWRGDNEKKAMRIVCRCL